MPSLWDLLCVSRQKYTTGHTSTKRRPPRQKWEDPRHQDGADTNYYLQPEYHFHRRAPEPYSRDSPPWHDDGHSSGKNRPNARIEEILRDGLGKDRESIPLLKGKPRSRRGEHRKEQGPGQPQRGPSLDPPVHNHGGVRQTSPEHSRRDRYSSSGRRRHVQDIFAEVRQQQQQYQQNARYLPSNTGSTSLPSSPSGQPQSGRSSRPRQTESMYQYSPRTVNDTAVSAALFGNRIDDFVHDPGWNRAIDRFAASPTSPTSNSSFSFNNDRGFLLAPDRSSSQPASDNFFFGRDVHGNSNTPRPPSGQSRVSSPRYWTEETPTPHSPYSHVSGSVLQGTASTLAETEHRTDRAADSRRSEREREVFRLQDVFRPQEQSYNGGQAASNRGSGVDIEKLFSVNGDVLY